MSLGGFESPENGCIAPVPSLILSRVSSRPHLYPVLLSYVLDLLGDGGGCRVSLFSVVPRNPEDARES